MVPINIQKVSEFTQGVARFTRIAVNEKTGVQAWRRSYLYEPKRNCIELITPQGGKYYPEAAKVMRRIPEDDNKLQEKIDFYLQNGLSVWFEGDEKKSIYDDNNN